MNEVIEAVTEIEERTKGEWEGPPDEIAVAVLYHVLSALTDSEGRE